MDPEAAAGLQPGNDVAQIKAQMPGAVPDIDADFDESMNPLWSLYGKMAKDDDKETLEDTTSGMDGLLIFAGLFSAVITAFIIDRTQAIQTTPAGQSAFYQNQTVVLLNQISQQLTSLGAQIPSLSNSSLPEFTPKPTASEVRVNIIWIVSLVISLTAALLATLIRQWSRDRMRLFQRYTTPLEVARIRQYLHEGTIRTRIAALAEAVPALVHISLFLFLAGLADFLWNSYKHVGKATLFSVVLCAALYIIITFAPVISPQSSYRTPCSPLVRYIARKLKLAEGRLQLAMKSDDTRKHRDADAIRWVVNSFTSNEQDLESLASKIPGSFDTMWGVDVWRDGLRGEEVKLYRDIRFLFETCRDRGSFKSDNEWQVRSRACTETIAVFVLFMDTDIKMIGDLGELLSYIGAHTREMAEMRSNQSFAIRWTCLSLLSIQKMLDSIQWEAHIPREKLVTFNQQGSVGTIEKAYRNAQTMDKEFAKACGHVERLRDVRRDVYGTPQENHVEAKISEILHEHDQGLISIKNEVQRMEDHGIDKSLSELQCHIDKVTHNLIRKLPGVAFDDITESTTVDQVLDFLANPVRPQFIHFSRLLRVLCAVNEAWANSIQDVDNVVRSIEALPTSLSQSRLMERQLWRILDVYNGSFGFTLELYFLSIGKLLSNFPPKSPPRGTHQDVFVKTFKVITSGRDAAKYSPGTRQIILNIVLDIAFQRRGAFSDVAYPNYITNELLDLLAHVTDKQADAYIEGAKREIYYGNLRPSTVIDPQFLPRARAILGVPAPAPTPVPVPAPVPGPSLGPEPGPAPALAPTN